jgi:hypothetical protein
MLIGHFDNAIDESLNCLRQIDLRNAESMNVIGTVNAGAKIRMSAICGLEYSKATRKVTLTTKIAPYNPMPRKKNWRCFSFENDPSSLFPQELRATASDRTFQAWSE